LLSVKGHYQQLLRAKAWPHFPQRRFWTRTRSSHTAPAGYLPITLTQPSQLS
jgi:hypothetical protein